jgi:hypothetical protein
MHVWPSRPSSLRFPAAEHSSKSPIGWVRRMALALLVLASPVVAHASATDEGRALAGQDLRRAISGKRVYLATPLGGEFPLYYRTDGRVDGSGEAVGLGRFLKPTDSGRWWVDGARLCQQWQTWYDGRVFCFSVIEKGNGRIGWLRDDGASGIARLAD